MWLRYCPQALRGWSQWIRVALLLATLCIALPSTARTVLDLDAARQPIALLDWGDWWIDPLGDVDAEAVDKAAAGEWRPTQAGHVYRVNSRNVLWIRFTVPPAPDQERWYLEIPQPSVNVAALYTRDGADQWNEQRAGDSVAVAQWPVPHRHPLLPLAVSAEEPRTFLLRIQNPNGFGAEIRFVSESHLSRSEQRTSLLLGIYFGLAGLAVMLSVLSAVSLRDTAYALYGPYVALMALTQASVTGIAGLHLWPQFAWWNDAAATVLPLATSACMLLFISAAVSLSERSRRANMALWSLAAIIIVASSGSILLDASLRPRINIPCIVAGEIAGIGVLVWAWRRGDRYALWVLAGLVPTVLLSFVPMLRVLGYTPHSTLALHGLQVAHAIELPIMLVVLMLRSQQRRENRRRIRGMDRIDPATGLINQQVFEERLAVLVTRAQRMQQPAAVLVVDVVNHEAMQRAFGRKSADELPLRVAGRLLSASRDIDSVARLGELRFGMLVEGPLPPQEAAGIGPRIVARCLQPFHDKPTDWTAQVRVAVALVPLDGVEPARLLQRLESVLQAVPADSRRGVFTLHDLSGRAS